MPFLTIRILIQIIAATIMAALRGAVHSFVRGMTGGRHTMIDTVKPKKPHPTYECCLCDAKFAPNRDLTDIEVIQALNAKGWHMVAPGTWVCGANCYRAGMLGLQLLSKITGRVEKWGWINHRVEKR